VVLAGIAVLAVAVAVVAIAPRHLTHAGWVIRHPAAALVAWAAAVVVGAAALVGGVALVVLAGRPVTDPLGVAESPVHGLNIGVAVAGCIAFALAVRVRPGPEHEAVRDAIRSGATARTAVGGTTVALVEADHALACAVPGRDGGVLLSTGLAGRLAPDELEAVVAHEHAHLRAHHAAWVATAESIERALPWVPGARAMARSTRVLVELAADDVAARRVGRDALRRAVTTADASGALGVLRASRLAGGPTARPADGLSEGRG
jgi:hypothetical protein